MVPHVEARLGLSMQVVDDVLVAGHRMRYRSVVAEDGATVFEGSWTSSLVEAFWGGIQEVELRQWLRDRQTDPTFLSIINEGKWP